MLRRGSVGPYDKMIYLDYPRYLYSTGLAKRRLDLSLAWLLRLLSSLAMLEM